jgi:pyruvate kinase
VIKKNKKILCTLGPASFDVQIMNRLEALGVNLFRINLSHTKLKDLPSLIQHIKDNSKVPICLDTEGAQIRTGDFIEPDITLRENTNICASGKRVPGNSITFNFTPIRIIDDFQIGDLISIDFNTALVQVIARNSEGVIMRVLNSGQIGRNKAVTVKRNLTLPPLTGKDISAIEIGKGLGLSNFALSFANSPSDVKSFRKLTGNHATIISKIESLAGLANLEAIAKLSDALLIDRGDLSRQVPLEQIPQVQKTIIKIGRTTRNEVFVATNLLESMVSNSVPTRAEVNDIYNTLLDGADGLVLAAETAIGEYPVECASMVTKIIDHFESYASDDSFDFLRSPSSLLVTPHGGKLINQYASDREKQEAVTLRKIRISDTALLDCEQIAHGTYSPISGFMDKKTVNSVLDNYVLPDGTIWTMPILLPISQKEYDEIKAGEKIGLMGKDETLYATLKVSELFKLELRDLALRFFSTESKEHPGVVRLFEEGEHFIAGEIQLLKRQPSSKKYYELTPAESRFIFSSKGWSQIIGFHTRNPVHRGHEYIQKKALEISGADGLYINPVTGPKKMGDFEYAYIMRSYETMLEFGLYPEGKTLLGSFATYSRYCGPREAIFTALCRKNMGCSHFIIGRDHTGVGAFYEKEAFDKLFSKVGHLGIEILSFPAIGFNITSQSHEEISNDDQCLPIDGTSIRNALNAGKKVEDWMMRELVQDSLLDLKASGEKMFVD